VNENQKSKCVKSNQTHCCTEKFNMALSLCRVLGVALYFSESFLKAATRVSAVAEALLSRLLMVDFIFYYLSFILFLFLFYFLFSIFRTTRVRVDQSCCHISHKTDHGT